MIFFLLGPVGLLAGIPFGLLCFPVMPFDWLISGSLRGELSVLELGVVLKDFSPLIEIS